MPCFGIRRRVARTGSIQQRPASSFAAGGKSLHLGPGGDLVARRRPPGVQPRCYLARRSDQEEDFHVTKAEFVERIAGNFDSKRAAADAVDAVLDGIQDTLAGGGSVNFT